MEPTGRGKGFTLVELIVVIAIISLFAAAAVPTIMGFRARRSRDIGDAALILRSTLRTARTYAIQNRVRAGVFFHTNGRRYHIEYEDRDTREWVVPLGTLGKEHVLPDRPEWMRISLDGTQDPDLNAHIFDPTGTLDSFSALKARIRVDDNDPEVLPVEMEILRSTGRVRIR